MKRAELPDPGSINYPRSLARLYRMEMMREVILASVMLAAISVCALVIVTCIQLILED